MIITIVCIGVLIVFVRHICLNYEKVLKLQLDNQLFNICKGSTNTCIA